VNNDFKNICKDRQTPLYIIVLQKSGFEPEKCINLADTLFPTFSQGGRSNLFPPGETGKGVKLKKQFKLISILSAFYEENESFS
jgi:hypothetical protein